MARWLAPLALALLAGSFMSPALAQPAPQAAPASGGELLPLQLPRAVYPPIAQSARVQGVVQVTLTVRPDGSVAAATTTSTALPLLVPAAVEAARLARFECRGCEAAGTLSYSIVYAFKMDGAAGASSELVQPPVERLSSASSRVTTVVESPVIVCGLRASLAVPARSIKCAWLWKCGYDVH